MRRGILLDLAQDPATVGLPPEVQAGIDWGEVPSQAAIVVTLPNGEILDVLECSVEVYQNRIDVTTFQDKEPRYVRGLGSTSVTIHVRDVVPGLLELLNGNGYLVIEQQMGGGTLRVDVALTEVEAEWGGRCCLHGVGVGPVTYVQTQVVIPPLPAGRAIDLEGGDG